jgi:hypothetical protein
VQDPLGHRDSRSAPRHAWVVDLGTSNPVFKVAVKLL